MERQKLSLKGNLSALYQAVNMITCAVKLDILTEKSTGIDSLLESVPSGCDVNCNI